MPGLLNNRAGPRRRPSQAARVSACVLIAVVCLSLPFGASAYRRHMREAQARFEARARSLQMTTLALLRDVTGLPRAVLRSAYQIEAGYGIQAALVLDQRVEVAHTVDWEGLEAGYVLGEEAWQVEQERLPPPGQLTVQLNRTANRFDAIASMPTTGEGPAPLLVVTAGAGSATDEAWRRCFAALRMGLLLALAAAAVVYAGIRRTVLMPVRKLQQRIDQRGLEVPFDEAGFGALQQLVDGLEQATRKLLDAEQHKRCSVQTELHRSEEESALQTSLLHHLLRDLRSSMAAVLGHAELLMTRDSKPADRIGYIRSIQKEARRIAHLARELHELLAPLTGGGQELKKIELPVEQLRMVVAKLSEAQSATLQIGTAPGRRGEAAAAAATDVVQRSAQDSPAPEPAVPTRLSGSILLLGRKDEPAQALLTELYELGLDAMWVPDLAAFEDEVSRGDYDVVIVNLSRGDRATRELSAAVRAHFTGGPVLAVLPKAAQVDSGNYTELGFDDYLYAPASRKRILAVIAKYIRFKPIA